MVITITSYAIDHMIGQLGNGKSEDQVQPVLIASLESCVNRIAASSCISAVLTKSETIYLWFVYLLYVFTIVFQGENK